MLKKLYQSKNLRSEKYIGVFLALKTYSNIFRADTLDDPIEILAELMLSDENLIEPTNWMHIKNWNIYFMNKYFNKTYWT